MSLIIGLLAAVAWAVHDLCVRQISQKSRILPSLITVLIAGTVVVAPVSAALGNWSEMTEKSVWLSIATGAAFAFANLNLYAAFSIGSVRLVAPVIGAYPILSVAWGVFTGTTFSLFQWLAVLVIVFGVAAVTILSDEEKSGHNTKKAILFASLAGLGFATTFAFGQAAVQHGPDWPVIALTRMTALVAIGFLMAFGGRSEMPPLKSMPMLALMGLLDATALALVTVAGNFPLPEIASVASSLFGLLTVFLAWAILKETMTRAQWIATVIVFCGVGYLGVA